MQILTLVGIAIKSSLSFTRKFELVSGWTALKVALPGAWNKDVREAAFGVLFGVVVGEKKGLRDSEEVWGSNVVCSSMLPAILAALDRELNERLFFEETEGMATLFVPLSHLLTPGI